MSEKHAVVQGAICQCQFGTTPDKLVVNSQSKEYADDKDGSKKLIASTKEIGGSTFEKNTFGSCSLQNNNPCKITITAWQGFYDKVTLTNGGKILLEDSKAGCPVGGPTCISITDHGQTAEMSSGNFEKADAAVHTQLNPLVNVQKVNAPSHDENVLIITYVK